jgi:hypothetical protein
MPSEKKSFFVVGLYQDNGQRFADTYKATTAEQAEKFAVAQARRDEGTVLTVTAVFEVESVRADDFHTMKLVL